MLRSTLGLIGRSLVVGLGYAFTLIVAGLIVSLLGLTPPDIAARLTRRQAWRRAFSGVSCSASFSAPCLGVSACPRVRGSRYCLPSS